MEEQNRRENEEHGVHRPEELEEISLREIIEVVLKGKKFIIFLLVVCVAASFLFTRYFQVSSYASTTVSMNFEEVEQGIYPSGRTFSHVDIVSPHVLGYALDMLGAAGENLEIQDLQEALSVEPLYRQEDEDEDAVPLYQYRITLQEHDSIPDSEQLKRHILSSIVESYRQNFHEELVDLPGFPSLSMAEGGLLEMDYPVIISVLRTYQDSLLNFSQELSERAEDFRSYRHGYTFSELEEKVRSLEEMHFQDIVALVNTYPLVRDKEAAVMHFKDMLRELEREEKKSSERSLFARELLEEARPLREGAILPIMTPSWAEGEDVSPDWLEEEVELEEIPADDIFSRLYEDNFYMELVQVSMDSALEAIDKDMEIEKLQREIQRLEGVEGELEAEEGELPEEEQVDEAELEMAMAEADEELTEFIGRLDDLSFVFNDMVQEFHEDVPKQAVSYVVTPYYMVDSGNLQLNAAVAAVLGLMLGVFIVFFHHYWEASAPSNTKQNEKEGQNEDKT